MKMDAAGPQEDHSVNPRAHTAMGNIGAQNKAVALLQLQMHLPDSL